MHNILIINFNTQLLTECCIKSINKTTPNCHIYVFDNSDKEIFKNTFENVTVFDNTKGKYINFNKWLKNYPKRENSPGKFNNFGSAKHAYSVQKCIELINDNFVLLDSDVLIKKDISGLYNDKYLYVAETVTQPNSTIKRVLPFICYINVKKLKEYKISYFDHNYMHGLNYKPGSDRYDTGGALYMLGNKYPHLDIKCEDYVEHYKGGSWSEKHMKRYKISVTPEQFLNYFNYLWSDKKNKKVIYTCITGKYDNLMELSHRNTDFDYVCFTDNTDIKSKFWQIKPIPNELKGLTTVKQQRCIKICPHKYLPEYELSVWIDGVVDVLDDVNKFIDENCKEGTIFIPKHPQRNCIYREGNACILMKKDTKENINKQLDEYDKEGFPKNQGLVQSNIIIRKHNDEDCVKLMDIWAKEVIKGSHRDQLSFNYSLWKAPTDKFVYLDKKTCNSKFFKWYATGHHSNIKKTQTTTETSNKKVPISIDAPVKVKTRTEKKSEEPKKKTTYLKSVTTNDKKKVYKTVKVRSIRSEKNREILRKFMGAHKFY